MDYRIPDDTAKVFADYCQIIIGKKAEVAY
jgi:hypothetical protein